MKLTTILLFSFAFLMLSCSDNTTNTPSDPTEYTNADGIKGGILFDKFWSTEAGYDQNSVYLTKFNASSDFFRCKQCHAWDLLGNSGSYNSRGPKTTRPNVASRDLRTTAKNLSAQALFDAIKNGISSTRRDISADLSTYDPATNPTVGDQMPKMSQLLTDTQIWNIVKFLKVEALDITKLYDATYTGSYPTGKATYTNIGKDGDATKGNAFYAANCASCHGADGKTFLMEGMTVGKFTRSKPNEVQHKIKFGQLGSSMKPTTVTLDDMKNLYKALSDDTKFPD